jgi:hypothetical protein
MVKHGKASLSHQLFFYGLDSNQRQLEVAYCIGENHVTKKSLFSMGYDILTG